KKGLFDSFALLILFWSTNMKIFYITSVLGDSGGSEIYTRDLIRELIKRGHKVMVCTPVPYNVKGAEMVFLPRFGHHALWKFEGPFFYGKALATAMRFRPDIIQSHSNSMMGIIGHLLKRKLRVPHVLLIELISSQNVNLHTKFIHFTERVFLPRLNYDRLVVWTEQMKKKFLMPWGVAERKIEIMPAAINLEHYPVNADGSAINKKYGRHLITSIKTLWGTNVKGLEYVVKAMREVNSRHPEYKYVIFGDGTEKHVLEEAVQKEGLGKCVELAGAIKPEKCREVWAATEIAPHGYVYEFSTSISLLEYMAMGKACVVTDIGNVRNFVGDAALVVKPYDKKAMAAGILRLIEDKKFREALGKKARSRVEKMYSIKASVDRLERIYSELLGKRAA
ncbi:MAG: glycosyltransferase family 4 protein, partial [Candidatus Diapherotrites archaeon]|nr:glycosyltransferase family 4 protein [Candidatus Diapherotrites archaeon]